MSTAVICVYSVISKYWMNKIIRRAKYFHLTQLNFTHNEKEMISIVQHTRSILCPGTIISIHTESG